MEILEEKLRFIRAENSDMKKDMSRMYSLVQSINTEIRNNNSLMNGRISTLSETLDYVSKSIKNVDSKMEDNYCNISDVEGKVERLKEDIGCCIPGFHDSKGSSCSLYIHSK